MFLLRGKYLHSYCHDCRKAKKREWYVANQEYAVQVASDWHYKNYEKVKENKIKSAIKWNEQNKEKRIEIIKKCYLKRRHKISAYVMKRKFEKSLATPKWLSSEHLASIDKLYLLRDLYSLFVGKKHEVDHIVPLKNNAVCGLHVPWNLRIISQFENRSKGNKFKESLNG
jgi:5-methylcytosine-specific restriction endonuclease McrA